MQLTVAADVNDAESMAAALAGSQVVLSGLGVAELADKVAAAMLDEAESAHFPGAVAVPLP
jgi:hypothetical protein